MTLTSLPIVRAQLADAPQVASCVEAAYQHYIARIGKPPGPMLDDYVKIISQHLVWIIKHEGQVVGLIVLMEKEGGMLLDNVAVHPAYQGQGVGRRLMAFAEREARQRGFDDLHLYTHEKMSENLKIYEKLGFVETERRSESGYERIYMKKSLFN